MSWLQGEYSCPTARDSSLLTSSCMFIIVSVSWSLSWLKWFYHACFFESSYDWKWCHFLLKNFFHVFLMREWQMNSCQFISRHKGGRVVSWPVMQQENKYPPLYILYIWRIIDRLKTKRQMYSSMMPIWHEYLDQCVSTVVTNNGHICNIYNSIHFKCICILYFNLYTLHSHCIIFVCVCIQDCLRKLEYCDKVLYFL